MITTMTTSYVDHYDPIRMINTTISSSRSLAALTEGERPGSPILLRQSSSAVSKLSAGRHLREQNLVCTGDRNYADHTNK